MKVFYYILVLQEGESAKVDSLLTIIGPEGTDVSSIVAAHKEGNISTATIEAKNEDSNF